MGLGRKGKNINDGFTYESTGRKLESGFEAVVD